MNVIGKIKRIKATKEVGQSNYKVRELVVTTEEQYPQTISIQFAQEKTALLDNFKPEDKVNVSISLRGKEVEKDGEPIVYNTINGWKIEPAV